MASTPTRRAPNCFNHLHMLRKMRVFVFNSDSDMGEWNQKSGLMKEFNIGPLEAAAALNMANRAAPDFCRPNAELGAENWLFPGVVKPCGVWGTT